MFPNNNPKSKAFHIYLRALVAIAFLVVVSYFMSQQSSFNATKSHLQGKLNPYETKVLLSQKRIVLPETHMLGSKTATVVLTQFSDYGCPACSAGWAISQKIIADYKNDSRFAFAFRQSPQSNLHPKASQAAEAAEAAAAQGKFWEMHQALFDHQEEWGKQILSFDFFEKYANDLGLDGARLKLEVRNGRYASVVNTDREDAKQYSILATPAFFINDQKYEGLLSYDAIKRAVQAALDAS